MRIRVLASFAAALMFVTGIGPLAAAPLPAGGSFRDDDGNVHEGSIETIAAAGITRGCNPPAFVVAGAMNFFASHPPMEERVKRLRAMA